MRVLYVHAFGASDFKSETIATLCKMLLQHGDSCLYAYGREKPAFSDLPSIQIGKEYFQHKEIFKTRIDRNSYDLKSITLHFLEEINAFHPDLIHLFDVHPYFLHIETFFAGLRSLSIPILWSLSDLWPIRGLCRHFDFLGTPPWHAVCGFCSRQAESPCCSSHQESLTKKELIFGKLPTLHLLPSSSLLQTLYSQSFLSKAPSTVSPEWVDTTRFFPDPGTVRNKLGILPKQKMIFSYCAKWDFDLELKWLVQLSQMLGETYKFVLGGNCSANRHLLPDSFLLLPNEFFTLNAPKLFSAADLFISARFFDYLTPEILCSLSCGTPVLSLGNLPDGLLDGQGVYLLGEDKQKTLALIERLCQPPPDPQKLHELAKPFDRVLYEQRMLKLYQAACGGSALHT